MRKTAILLALACALARADYGPGTTDSDLLRSGTPVVTNAWLAVSNDTAGLVRSMAGDKITDGTNMIDAARNVYLVRDNCWIRIDGLVLVPSAENEDTWVSITNTIYGEVSLYNSGSMWEEFESAIPTFLYRDGATLTNEDGRVVYRAGEYNSTVGRLALTNDIPSVVDADLTPATNYTDYAMVRFSQTNSVLSGGPYQTKLPYPTNAVPYSAVTGAPDVPSLAGLPPFDFADMRGVYLSLSNIIHALGGSVINFPTFNE